MVHRLPLLFGLAGRVGQLLAQCPLCVGLAEQCLGHEAIRDTRLAGSLQAPALSEVLQDHSLSVLRQRTVLALQRRSESINATDRHPLRLRHLLCRRLVAEQLLLENLYGTTEA